MEIVDSQAQHVSGEFSRDILRVGDKGVQCHVGVRCTVYFQGKFYDNWKFRFSVIL
jgi:hypothetical protein